MITEKNINVEALLAENEQLKKEIEKLKERLAQQQWQEQQERFSILIYQHFDKPLETWAQQIIKFLHHTLEAATIAFYIKEEDVLVRIGGYALPPEVPQKIPLGEGITGQCAITAKPIVLQNHFHYEVPSGDIQLRAQALYVVPLVFRNEVVGVLEYATLFPHDEKRWKIAQQLLKKLAEGLHGYKNQLRIQKLLRETQEKNLLLQQQEEELRQNLEALEIAHEQMRQAQAALKEMNETLEQKVKERTKALEEALQELKNTQEQLILSEKMAALGQLVANIAHEINTPIGAVKASAENITYVLPYLIQNFYDFLASLNEDQRKTFQQLLLELLHEPLSLTSKEERKLRKNYQDLLKEAGLSKEDSRLLAKTLVEAGFHGDLTPYKELFLSYPDKEKLQQALYNIGQIITNTYNILGATEKTSKIVYALKAYSHTSAEAEKEPIVLKDTIDTALTIYQNQLKQGISLDVHVPEHLPLIEGHPDALTQVWINLIQNAIQAMGGKGSLTIEAIERGNTIEVRFIDSGSGIPPEIQDKIFEPFFTTKKAGEGTGLGLDICRRIIEKHQGKIFLEESRPGRTVFTVVLPIASEQR